MTREVWFKNEKSNWSKGEVVGTRQLRRTETVIFNPRSWIETKLLIRLPNKKAYLVWESETYEAYK